MASFSQVIQSLPFKAHAMSDGTVVVGDLNAFMHYVETGLAYQDWQERCEVAAREREDFFRDNQHFWQQIVHHV